MNEGENLEINIQIEAYPQIKEQWWDIPMSHNHNISTHDDTWAVRYNNRSLFSTLVSLDMICLILNVCIASFIKMLRKYRIYLLKLRCYLKPTDTVTL